MNKLYKVFCHNCHVESILTYNDHCDECESTNVEAIEVIDEDFGDDEDSNIDHTLEDPNVDEDAVDEHWLE